MQGKKRNQIGSVGKLKLLLQTVSSDDSKKFAFQFFKVMNFTMKTLLLISLALTAISSTRSTDAAEKYDITTLLNNSIVETFENMNSVAIIRLILSMENLYSNTFQTEVDCELGPFQNEFYFTGITITALKLDSINIRHEFYSNKMIVFITYLSIEMKGYLGATPYISHMGFERTVDFKNISIVAQTEDSFSKNEFYIDFTYQGYESSYIHLPWFPEEITSNIQYELERQVKQMMPSLFLHNLRNNENFLWALGATFSHHPEAEITLLYPSFDKFRTKYYYFIPNITSLDRTLSNISITGMSNFHSHSFAANSGFTVGTLIIKPVRGNANLHYGRKNFTIFSLAFEVDCISILIDRNLQRVSVTAYNYTVTDTKMNVSLTEYQSKWVMDGIQMAIASSIMPSMRYYRNINESSSSLMEHPIVKISTTLSEQFQGSTIQKLYDDMNLTVPETFTAESSIQIGLCYYNISIHATPGAVMKLYPDWIQCNFYSNLMVSFEIPTYLFGKMSLCNATHKLNDIDFLLGNIFIMLVKHNNSNGFELKTNMRTDVQLLSNPDNFTINDQWSIKRKTKALLISPIQKSFVRFAEPLLSLPLDYCTTPVKIFDDFLPFYADHELPYRVPEDRTNNNFFISKINNVIITDWGKPRNAWVSIFFDFSTENISSTSVYLQLAEAKIRMNFNDSLMAFHELELTLGNLLVQNSTDTGEIKVNMDSRRWNTVSENNKTTSRHEIFWIEDKLQRIIGDSFNNLTR